PLGHHAVNIFLHAVNVCLFYLLGLRICRARRDQAHGPGTADAGENTDQWPMICGMGSLALLFGIHPAKVESVAWVSDRKDLLCALFLLLSALVYMRRGSPERTRMMYGFSLLFFALGVLSKPVAIMFPCALFALGYFLEPADRSSRGLLMSIFRLIPFLLMSLAGGIVAGLVTLGGKPVSYLLHISLIEKALLPAYTLLLYLRNFFWPVSLTPFYAPPESLTIWVSAVVLGAAGVGLFFLRRMKVPLLLSFAAYAILLLPTIIGNRTGIQLWADRYSYIPGIPLFLLAGVALSQALRRPPWAGISPNRIRAFTGILVLFVMVAAGYVTR
ncbi:MAG: hypothetical protein WCK00_15615, partial [Deltaproteobacteria bacterium]